MYEGQAMFPPVLTTEGARGWAARPGSRDDPTPGRIPVAPRISRPERVVSTRPARTGPRSWRGPNYRIVHHRARNVQVYDRDNPRESGTDGRDATRSMTRTNVFNDFVGIR